jgi:hypothetical protein
VNPRWIWLNNSPWVALEKFGALKIELSEIGFLGCEAWRVPKDFIITVGIARATTLRLPGHPV